VQEFRRSIWNLVVHFGLNRKIKFFELSPFKEDILFKRERGNLI